MGQIKKDDPVPDESWQRSESGSRQSPERSTSNPSSSLQPDGKETEKSTVSSPLQSWFPDLSSVRWVGRGKRLLFGFQVFPLRYRYRRRLVPDLGFRLLKLKPRGRKQKGPKESSVRAIERREGSEQPSVLLIEYTQFSLNVCIY